MTRDDFRNAVFERDGHKCVICQDTAKDAHHIMERRLFSDGGYYIDNGASLCERHHIEAEQTIISPQDLRDIIGILKPIIPEHLYADQEYDKWGNFVLPNGKRLKGELFYDESVQKVLKSGNVLDLFDKHVKYPRTYHVHWSQLGKDDKMLPNDNNFHNKEVVVTIKMDGENTTMYNDYIHARSIDGNSHPSRNWVKGLWSQISYLLDDNMRLCGENLYAKHSIAYNNLPSYFMVFSIWIDHKCLSWEDTEAYTKILGLNHVPVIYKGIYNKKAIELAFAEYQKKDNAEGFVIRLAEEFEYGQFKNCVAKYVKPEFRQIVNNAHGHWISQKIEPNKLNNE